MFSDAIYPFFCIACGKELQKDYLCKTCLETLSGYAESRCPVCSKRLPEGRIICPCKEQLKFSRFIYALPYKHPIGRAILHHLKYLFIKDLADPLGIILSRAINSISSDYKEQNLLLIPIPLAEKRLRWRGFNQSELISTVIADELNLEIIPKNIFIRIKNNTPQLNLSRKERLHNVKDIFAVTDADKIKNRNILLIDDVATTCSTLKEAALTLKQNGARDIWTAVIAKE